jgi:hypothetical protein
MNRKGRIGGVHTNKTRARGRCSKKGCGMCHSSPACKAACKVKGVKNKQLLGNSEWDFPLV